MTLKLKAGQRWLWDNTFTAVVEILEDSFGDNYRVRCCILQQDFRTKSCRCEMLGQETTFVFCKANMRHWTYLTGQDNPKIRFIGRERFY